MLVFQLSYTTLFGAYVGWIYLATHDILAIIVVHAFCNVMGFPDLNYRQKGHVLHSYSTCTFLGGWRISLHYFVIIVVSISYGLGIVLFIYLMKTLPLHPHPVSLKDYLPLI